VYSASSGTVSLEVSATDQGSGVANIHFSRWDAVNQRVVDIATDTAQPYQAYIDIGILNSGYNEIDADAVDKVGNPRRTYFWIYRTDASPVAGFDASPLSGSAPLTVSMHNISTGNITSCAWDYGDGTSGTACATYHDHIYLSAGSYTVQLTVTGPGGSDTQVRTNYIVVSAPPVDLEVTTIQAAASPICAGSSVDFTAFIRNNGSLASGFFDIRWNADGQLFDGGDNSISPGATITHPHSWLNIPQGQHTLTFIADFDQRIAESNENNNQYTLTFTAINCSSAELLGNPGFEESSSGKPSIWSTNSKFTSSSTLVHSGSFSGRFFATDNSGTTISQVVSNLTAGTTYAFSGWVYLPSTTDTFTFKLQVLWLKSSGSTIRTDTVKTYSNTSTKNIWDQATKSLVAPTGAVKARVQMVVSSLKTTIYVDDFSLQGGTPAPDTTPPSVTVQSPGAGASNVTVGANVTATFSEAMNAATITNSSFTLTPQGGSAVAASVSYDTAAKTATLDPDSALTANTTYTARLAGTITDVAGNSLASAPVTWSFTTATQSGSARIKDITFEGASLTGGSTGADVANGTVTLASPGLKGTYAAAVNSATSYLTENFSAADELFVSFYFQLNSLPSSNARIAQILNGSTTVGDILVTTSGKLRLRNDSTAIGTDSAALSVGTVYRIGLHQKKGSSGNAVLEVYLAAGDVPFGSAFASSATQSFTSQATSFRFGATNANVLIAQFDDILLDSAAMP
jgi:PKD repeat protein